VGMNQNSFLLLVIPGVLGWFFFFFFEVSVDQRP
jgi:hypothetical protein